MPRLLTPVKGWSYQPDRYSELLSNMLPSDELFRLQTYNIYPYPPNDYGLYDMAGNAAEWCWDWYTHAGPPAGSTNSTGPASGTRRVIRGGHCLSNTDRVTVYRRSFAKPDKVSDIVGFRYVRRRM
jgi:formylglycine-generating enzyme required for sulfatase activity